MSPIGVRLLFSPLLQTNGPTFRLFGLSISLDHLNLKLSAFFFFYTAFLLFLDQFAMSPPSVPSGFTKCIRYRKIHFSLYVLQICVQLQKRKQGLKKKITKIIKLK